MAYGGLKPTQGVWEQAACRVCMMPNASQSHGKCVADIFIVRVPTDTALSMLASPTSCSTVLAQPGASEQLATFTPCLLLCLYLSC